MDKSEALLTFFSTFGGFILAIFASYIYDWIKSRREQSLITLAITSELEGISESIRNDLKVDQFYLSPIKTSYWDGLISMGKLDLIKDEKWFSSVQTLFGKIQDINKWHDLLTSTYFDMMAQDQICEERLHQWRDFQRIVSEKQSNLRDEINKLLPKMINTRRL